MVDEKPLSSGPKAITSRGRKVELTDLSTHEAEPQRASSGIDELDRVLGGGLVAASAVLLGGRPWDWKINFNAASHCSFCQ